MNERDYERAKLAGTGARQAGKPREANPYRNKPSLRVLAEAWEAGWIEADRINGRGKHGRG